MQKMPMRGPFAESGLLPLNEALRTAHP